MTRAGVLLDILVELVWRRPIGWDVPLTYTHGHPSHVAMWSESAKRWVYWT